MLPTFTLACKRSESVSLVMNIDFKVMSSVGASQSNWSWLRIRVISQAESSDPRRIKSFGVQLQSRPVAVQPSLHTEISEILQICLHNDGIPPCCKFSFTLYVLSF